MKEIKPIAMRCTQGQFEKIEELLKENGFNTAEVCDFNYAPYLVNNFNAIDGKVNNVSSSRKDFWERTVFEEWNKETFLEYCGIGTFPEKWYIETCKEVGDWLDRNSDLESFQRAKYGYANTTCKHLCYPSYEGGHLRYPATIKQVGYKEITLQQFKQHYLKENKMTTKITATQLLDIHKIACSDWKQKLTEYLSRIDKDQNIEFYTDEIEEMFKAATPEQESVLESIFGTRKPVIDYDRIQTGSVVRIKHTKKYISGDIDYNKPVNVVLYNNAFLISGIGVFLKGTSHFEYCTFEQGGKYAAFAGGEIDYITEVILY